MGPNKALKFPHHPGVNFHCLEQVLGVSSCPPAQHTLQPVKIFLFLIARAALCQAVQQQSPGAAVQGPCAWWEEQENTLIGAWKQSGISGGKMLGEG